MKKYKLFIDCVLVLLCLFPLLSLLLVVYSSSTILTGDQIVQHVQNYCISDFVYDTLLSALNGVGFNLDGVFSSVVGVILTNSLLIYVFYVFIEVLVFVPKMAIKLLRIGVRKDD